MSSHDFLTQVRQWYADPVRELPRKVIGDVSRLLKIIEANDAEIARLREALATHRTNVAEVYLARAEAAEAKLKLAFESGQRVGEEIRDDVERLQRQVADERAAGIEKSHSNAGVVASSIEDTRLLLSDILTFFYHSAPSNLMDNTIADSLAKRIRTALTAMTERP